MNAPDRAAWLNARKSGIGGSDIAAVLGLSPYRSAVDVWMDKSGRAPAQEESEAMYWGTVLEDVVAHEYQKRTGNKVQRLNKMVRHPEHDWMIANLDRLVAQDGKAPYVAKTGEIRTKHLLECKTASAYKAQEWGAEGDADTVPVGYVAQAMWYLAVTGAQIIDVACLIGGQRYVQKRIERDEDTIAGMISKARVFWHENVLSDIPPEATSGEDVAALFPQDTGAMVEANAKTLELMARAQDMKAQIKALELELDGDKKRGILGVTGSLKTFMGEASGIQLGGLVLATWKKAADSQKTNWKQAADDLKAWAIEEDIPDGVEAIRDIINSNTTTQAGSRRLIIKE